MVEQQHAGSSSAQTTLASVLRGLIVVVSATTAGIVGHVFRALDAVPSEVSAVSPRQPTIAVALILLATAAVAFGASVILVGRSLTSAQVTAFLVVAVVLLIAAWAFHQALSHLVFGRGHVGPSW